MVLMNTKQYKGLIISSIEEDGGNILNHVVSSIWRVPLIQHSSHKYVLLICIEENEPLRNTYGFALYNTQMVEGGCLYPMVKGFLKPLVKKNEDGGSLKQHSRR